MVPPLPKLPIRYLLGALVASAVLVVATAWVDPASRGERIVHDGLQALAGIAVAVTGAGGVLRVWQRNEWKRRTQRIAYDQLAEAMLHVAGITSRAFSVLGARGAISDVARAFALPWTDSRQALANSLAAELERTLAGSVTQAKGSDGRATNQGDPSLATAVAERASAATTDLEARVEKLRLLAVELGAYLDGDPIKLLDDVLQMRKSIRKLAWLELVSEAPGEQRATVATVVVVDVLGASLVVGRDLGAEYSALRRRRVTDTRLNQEIKAEEEAVERDLQTLMERRALMAEARQTAAEAQVLAQEGSHAFDELLELLRELDPEDIETLRDVQKGLEMVRDELTGDHSAP